MNRRLGRFKIEVDLIENKLDLVKIVLDEIVVVEAEFHFDDQCVHYLGISDKFKEVEEGNMAPHYDWYADREENTVHFDLRR